MVWVPIWREALPGMTPAAHHHVLRVALTTPGRMRIHNVFGLPSVRARSLAYRARGELPRYVRGLVLESSVALLLWWRHNTGHRSSIEKVVRPNRTKIE